MRSYYFLIFSFISLNSYGNCDFKDVNDLFSEIKKNHPVINISNLKKEEMKENITIAKQVPNMEMELDTSRVDTLDGDSYKFGGSIEHTFELGGKRSARVELAHKENAMNFAVAQGRNESAIIQVVLRLYRLRQLYELAPIYKESLRSFSKILKKLKGQKSLSPEQRVEKETLELAASDYKLKISRLNSEIEFVSRHLNFFLGKECQLSQKILPSFKGLVDLDELDLETKGYSKLKQAEESLNYAKANLSHQKSIAFPNMKLGPSFEYEKLPIGNNYSVGLGLTIDLPFFNTNKGGRSKALKEINTQRKIYENTKVEASLDLKSWTNKYRRFWKSLKTTPNKKTLKKKHDRIERLFRRGIISTDLVIETHRQLVEYTTTRFEFELGAVEALWNIYKINGKTENKEL